MARQEGLIQLTGRMANISFYKTQDGYLARKKSGVSRERIMTDRAYARTRENIAEFGRGAVATSLLRRAFRSVILDIADNRVTGRLTSAVMKVIKSDAINSRGERNVADGEVNLLEGFAFNRNAALDKTFEAPFTAAIDRETGLMTIDIPAFKTDDMIIAPKGATHFRFKIAGAAIDFRGDTCSVATSQSADLPIDQKMQGPLTLNHTVAPASADPLFLLFGIEFVQSVNGEQCPMQNGVYNAMTIVKVDGSRVARPQKKERNIDERNIAPVHSRNESPVRLISEGQWIRVTSKARTLLREPSPRKSPLIRFPIPKIHAWLVRLYSTSPTFKDAHYTPANNGFVVHDDDRGQRLNSLPGTFESRDG